jgi:Sterol-sensing domain of SREBP cleavage-activation
VLVIPPEASTVSRISNALGDIGHLALARAAQNLLILWLLSRAVWVTAFCMFSAIALVLDFYFHLTFFLAVLSVDMQRMDLQDSLDRSNLAQGSDKVAGAGKQRWTNALLHSKLPLSTRVAGTAVMVCFVTALNWHFFDNESPVQSLSHLVNTFRSNQSTRAFESLTTPTITVNQARSPTSWLRLQYHDTAKEVIRLVKPHAHSFVAQVYDPLVFVIKGADRGKPENTKHSFLYTSLPTIPETARDHILPFALLIVLILAVITILMNYLLWSEVSDDITGTTDPTEPHLSIKTFSEGHALDVVMLSASSSGTLASVGLDRRIIVRSFKMGWGRNVTEAFQPVETERPFWPVVALALDDCSNWLAICSRSGLISFLDLQHQSVARSIDVDLDDQQPSAFFFTPEHDTLGARLIIVKPDGWIIEIDPCTLEVFKQSCCCSKIVAATAVLIPKLPLKVFTATKYGCICSTARSANGWEKEKFGIAEQSIEGDKRFLPVSSIVALPVLGLLLVAGHCQVELVNPQSGVVIYRFKTSQVKAGSLRAIHARRRQCSGCLTGFGVSSFSILYTESETHCFNMHTYTLNDKQKNIICLHTTEDSTESGCQSFSSATMTAHQTQNAGTWEVTAANSAIGVRKKSMRLHSRDYYTLHTHRSRLRRRRAREREAAKLVEDDYEWEAWTMSARGEVTTSPISTKAADGELFVSKVGPICKIGMCSVVVGFGNSIKLLVAGNERFDNRESELEEPPFTALGHRRRLQVRKSQ